MTFASINTNATNGLGSITLTGNTWSNGLSSPTFTTTIGCYVKPTSAIKSLIVDNNNFIDVQAVPTSDYSMYIDAGAITNFSYKGNTSIGMAVQEYFESGAVTYDRIAELNKIAFTPAFSGGGTPITLGNGLLVGFWTLNGKTLRVQAVLTIGSTTVIPGGALTLASIFTAASSGTRSLGNWVIFDSSASIFETGLAAISGTSNAIDLVQDGGVFVTGASPVALADGDTVSVQLEFYV